MVVTIITIDKDHRNTIIAPHIHVNHPQESRADLVNILILV
jgi:hypothetical protein